MSCMQSILIGHLLSRPEMLTNMLWKYSEEGDPGCSCDACYKVDRRPGTAATDAFTAEAVIRSSGPPSSAADRSVCEVCVNSRLLRNSVRLPYEAFECSIDFPWLPQGHI